ncbi:unnamed protein product [Aureobasidium vineae]|uniref:Uncharacterized protein n=1 Tax=Aureobasidium vineae TaxID=2773715 RepID=A0A9N8K2R7_9PEZI|nr:unnamed protein product [Aureobasidium vineae]
MLSRHSILALLSLLLVSQVQAQSEPIPSTGTCSNLTDVFGNSSHSWPCVVENAEQCSPQNNYTTLFYKQLNETGLAVGKDAARIVKVWPYESCRETDASPWYGFSCQSNGSMYNIPAGIKSLSVVDRWHSNNEDEGHCWTLAEDGRTSAASTTFQGYFAAMMAAILTGVILAM